MDYNKEDKGFVCAIYRLTCGRMFYAVLVAVGVAFMAGLGFEYYTPLAVVTFAPALVMIAPKLFLLKLAGFLAMLGGVFVSIHQLNKIESVLVYPLGVFGVFLLVILLSWFVYNARSSEINEL